MSILLVGTGDSAVEAAGPPPFGITSFFVEPPSGNITTNFVFSFAASGGTGPYSWALRDQASNILASGASWNGSLMTRSMTLATTVTSVTLSVTSATPSTITSSVNVEVVSGAFDSSFDSSFDI